MMISLGICWPMLTRFIALRADKWNAKALQAKEKYDFLELTPSHSSNSTRLKETVLQDVKAGHVAVSQCRANRPQYPSFPSTTP